MQKFRKGDTVNITTTVKYDMKPWETGVTVELGYPSLTVDATDVYLLKPQLYAGETVRHDLGCVGTVLGVNDDMVWVKTVAGAFNTWPLAAVTLVTNSRSEPDAESPTLYEIVGASA